MPAGIIGTDGYTPTYQPDARWVMWNIAEIYRGEAGQNRYIPKVNDYVIEPTTFTTYIVKSINPVTYVPTLVPIKPLGSIFIDSDLDILLGDGIETYRAYLDTNTSPFTLVVDGMLKIYGSSSSYARIYKGPFVDESKLISKMYDNSGNFIGSDVPLELVAFNSHDNYSIKTVKACNTLEDLTTGEIVTVVIHSNDGNIISKRSLLVENTNYIPRAFNEQKYITNISITSPFLSNTQPNTINFPINIPVAALPILGVVQYNDGTSVTYPVNGGKFTMIGLEQFVSTIIGHKVPLVLSYRLDPSEPAIGGVTSDQHYITKPYTLNTVEPNTSYNVKLFVYPEWVNATNGYKLKFFLMNLDRNVLYDVSTLVYSSSNTEAFDPLAYGAIQRLTYSINLKDVSSYFSYFIHVQTFDVILRSNPSLEIGTPWEVSSEVPNTVGTYGANLKAIIMPFTNNHIKVDNNIATVNEWLAKVYTKTIPLINPNVETTNLVPTHIEVKYGSASILKTIAEYNTEFVFSSPVPLYKNVEIVFLKQIYSGYLKLSIASMTVR